MPKYKNLAGLNPCCNGRCTRTIITSREEVSIDIVLILVVMEDALARHYLLLSGSTPKVLILVVMEDALALVQEYRKRHGLNKS